MKAAIFSHDYKPDVHKISNLNLLLEVPDLPASIRGDARKLQDIIGINVLDTRYPKYRNTVIPHERFDRKSAQRSLDLAKQIMDAVTDAYFS